MVRADCFGWHTLEWSLLFVAQRLAVADSSGCLSHLPISIFELQYQSMRALLTSIGAQPFCRAPLVSLRMPMMPPMEIPLRQETPRVSKKMR